MSNPIFLIMWLALLMVALVVMDEQNPTPPLPFNAERFTHEGVNYIKFSYPNSSEFSVVEVRE